MRERICLQIQITVHDSREGKVAGSSHMTAEKARRQDLVTSHIISSQKQRNMNERVVTCPLTCAQLWSLLRCVPGPCLDRVLPAVGCVFQRQLRKMRQSPTHIYKPYQYRPFLSMRQSQLCLSCVPLSGGSRLCEADH